MDYVGLNPFLGSVNPFLGNDNSIPYTAIAAMDYDLSLRRDGTKLYPNSLGDLTKRENRFLHNPGGDITAAAFPFAVSGLVTAAGFNGHLTGAGTDGQSRTGEDIILTNVIAFDVKVFDPNAVISGGSGVLGEYVDLGGARVAVQNIGIPFPPAGIAGFSTNGVRVSNAPTSGTLLLPTYDTWSTHYESNGLNENGNLVGGSPLIDEGTNGQDDNFDGVPDDPAERETSPPYPAALRGIEIAIRCYDPQSRQVRQVTVRHTFVPH